MESLAGGDRGSIGHKLHRRVVASDRLGRDTGREGGEEQGGQALVAEVTGRGPTADRPCVAVATTDGATVNEHLGYAVKFLVYKAEGGHGRMVEARDAPPKGGGEERWRKLAAVLRLLRGEDLEMISRELGVTAAALSGWRESFLAGGEAAPATREKDSRDLDIERLKTQLGEMLLDRELLKDKIRHLEAGRPLGRRSKR